MSPARFCGAKTGSLPGSDRQVEVFALEPIGYGRSAPESQERSWRKFHFTASCRILSTSGFSPGDNRGVQVSTDVAAVLVARVSCSRMIRSFRRTKKGALALERL